MKIYTPGHGLAADTLIMHGVVRHLVNAGITDGVVKRIGERYAIEVDKTPPKPEQLETTTALIDQVRAYQTLKDPAAIEYTKLGKIYRSNINPSVFDKWIADMAESLKEADLADLTDPQHKKKRREGRTTSKTMYTVYLTFTPTYGKYTIQDYRAYDNKKYGVCPTCFAMLNIGLLHGAAALVRATATDIDVILLTPAPAAETPIIDIAIIQRLTERYTRLDKEIPTAAAPIYWLSTGETLYATDTPMELLTWRIQKTGNFQRATDTITTDLGKLLQFVAELKWQTPKWPKCAQWLIDNDHADILADIFHYAIHKGEYYPIARKLTTATKNKDARQCEVDKITDTLAKWHEK